MAGVLVGAVGRAWCARANVGRGWAVASAMSTWLALSGTCVSGTLSGIFPGPNGVVAVGLFWSLVLLLLGEGFFLLFVGKWDRSIRRPAVTSWALGAAAFVLGGLANLLGALALHLLDMGGHGALGALMLIEPPPPLFVGALFGLAVCQGGVLVTALATLPRRGQ